MRHGVILFVGLAMAAAPISARAPGLEWRLARAQTPKAQCGEYEKLIELIAAAPHGERQAGQGQGKWGPMELWLSDDGASWSWIMRLSDGITACLVDAGHGWRPAPGKPI